MNPALFAAANKQSMARMQILTRLQQDGATSRDKAIAQDSLPSDMQAQAKYFISKGILRSTQDGGLYLDKRAYEDYQASMKTAGKWVLAVMGVSTLIGLAILVASKT
jgi:transaldolase